MFTLLIVSMLRAIKKRNKLPPISQILAKTADLKPERPTSNACSRRNRSQSFLAGTAATLTKVVRLKYNLLVATPIRKRKRPKFPKILETDRVGRNQTKA